MPNENPDENEITDAVWEWFVGTFDFTCPECGSKMATITYSGKYSCPCGSSGTTERAE